MAITCSRVQLLCIVCMCGWTGLYTYIKHKITIINARNQFKKAGLNVVLKPKHMHATGSVFLCFLFHFGICIGFCFASCVSTLVMYLVSAVSEETRGCCCSRELSKKKKMVVFEIVLPVSATITDYLTHPHHRYLCI